MIGGLRYLPSGWLIKTRKVVALRSRRDDVGIDVAVPRPTVHIRLIAPGAKSASYRACGDAAEPF